MGCGLNILVRTGPAYGKVVPKYYEVVLCDGSDCVELDVNVYIHLKGYADAMVTHVDVEEGNWSLIQEAFETTDKTGVEILSGKGYLAVGKSGVELVIFWDVDLPDTKCSGVLGVKEGGVYIGVCSEVLESLEEYAKRRLEG